MNSSCHFNDSYCTSGKVGKCNVCNYTFCKHHHASHTDGYYYPSSGKISRVALCSHQPCSSPAQSDGLCSHHAYMCAKVNGRK